MSAICAACMTPIAKGEKFVLARTEVFHRTCASDIAESIGNRQQQEIASLKRELEVAKRNIFEQDRRVAEQAQRANLWNANASTIRAERDLAEAKVVTLKREVELGRSMRDSTIQRLTGERNEARTERDAARAESALHQMLGASIERNTAPVQVTDERDATEIRFSLLELDVENENKP